MTEKKYPLVVVVWLDAFSTEIPTGSEPLKGLERADCGFLIEQNDKGLRLARCYCLSQPIESRFQSYLTIPKSLIIKIYRTDTSVKTEKPSWDVGSQTEEA